MPFPNLSFNRRHVDGIEALLNQFGLGAFASPFRSTVPLVALVKDDWPQFQKIANACGCSGKLSVDFEYEVPVPGLSKGNASQTDAMVFSEQSAIAIEAKWTEPRYETVARRLKSRIAQLTRKEPANEAKHVRDQRAVIDGWLGLLQKHSGNKLGLDDAGEVVYQMIHRTGSACATCAMPAVVYLHFEPSPAKGAASTAQYRADMAHLHRLMGNASTLAFFLVEMPISPTVDFSALASLPKRTASTDHAVRQALATTRLFQFGEPVIERIS